MSDPDGQPARRRPHGPADARSVAAATRPNRTLASRVVPLFADRADRRLLLGVGLVSAIVIGLLVWVG